MLSSSNKLVLGEIFIKNAVKKLPLPLAFKSLSKYQTWSTIKPEAWVTGSDVFQNGSYFPYLLKKFTFHRFFIPVNVFDLYFLIFLYSFQVHHLKCGRYPVSCPNRCDSGILCREELDGHLKDKCTSLVACCPFKDAGCRYKGPRYSLDKHLDESTKQHLTLMCGVVAKQQHQISNLKSALSKVSLNYSGTLIWKISDVSTKIAEAKTKDGVELVSPPFYTSQYGYKLQASLFLNGNGAGESSHVSVYIKILPGDYDALLRWPFSHSVSFTLFDQTTVTEKVNLHKNKNYIRS